MLVTDYVAYDEYGRVKERRDARGTTTIVTFGGPNLAFPTGTSRGDLSITYTYHPTYNQVIQIDENGFETNYEYDDFGRLKHIRNDTDELLSVFTYTYGLPSSIQTKNQLTSTDTVTTIQYLDGLGRTVQTTVENGAQDVVTAIQYDEYGRVKKTFKPYFHQSTGYDGDYATNADSAYVNDNGRPYVEVKYLPDPLNRVDKTLPEGESFYGVDQNHFTDSTNGLTYVDTVDESFKRARAYADKFGNIVKKISGLGSADAATTLFTYDVLGDLIEVADPNGFVTTLQRDPFGRLLKKISVDAGTVQYKYDKNGNLRFSQDARQAVKSRVSFTVYDEHNRAIRNGEAPLGTIGKIPIAPIGLQLHRAVKISTGFASLNPDLTQSFENASNNWLSVRRYDDKPSSSNSPWSLFPEIDAVPLSNLNGRLAASAQKSVGKWQVTLYSYNPSGFVTRKYVYSEGLPLTNTTFVYTLDRQGNPTRVHTQVGPRSFYHFYDYDQRGFIKKVYTNTNSSKPSSPDVTFSDFTPSGQSGNVAYPGGASVPYSYTIRGWIDSIGDFSNPTASFAAKYEYNRNGTVRGAQFKQVNSPSPTKEYEYSFVYDSLKRLKSADCLGGASFDMSGTTYDKNGNIKTLTRRKENGSIIDQLTFNYESGNNRLNSVSDAIAATSESWDAEDASFSYDANGNIVSAGALYNLSNFIYDRRNLPEQMSKSGTSISYRYSADGQRYYKKVGGASAEHYVLDDDVTAAVFDVNGNLKHWNIIANGATRVGGSSSTLKTISALPVLWSTIMGRL